MNRIRIAFLHLCPRAGNLWENYASLHAAIRVAADWGADWILTPELALPGHQFADLIGTDWIAPRPDSWIDLVCQLSAELDTTIFLGHPERDPLTDRLHNSLVVIESGRLLGAHRKVNVVPGAAERWSAPGRDAHPVVVGGVSVGLLVCADAYTPALACRLKEQGARLLVSAAAWAPRPYGPGDCWEQRSLETGLPLFVCNRTGHEPMISFVNAETAIVNGGKRLLSFHAPRSSVVLVDWALEEQALIAWRKEPVEFDVSTSLSVS